MKSKLSLRYCIIYTTEKQFRSNKNPKIKENIYLKKQLDARLSSSLQQISFAKIFQRLSPFRNSLFEPFFWEMNIKLTLWDVMLQYQTFSEYSVYRRKESSEQNKIIIIFIFELLCNIGDVMNDCGRNCLLY